MRLFVRLFVVCLFVCLRACLFLSLFLYLFGCIQAEANDSGKGRATKMQHGKQEANPGLFVVCLFVCLFV